MEKAGSTGSSSGLRTKLGALVADIPICLRGGGGRNGSSAPVYAPSWLPPYVGIALGPLGRGKVASRGNVVGRGTVGAQAWASIPALRTRARGASQNGEEFFAVGAEFWGWWALVFLGMSGHGTLENFGVGHERIS
jgi:hypothetical protein